MKDVGDTMNTIKILGVKVNIITMEETLDWIEKTIAGGVPRQIITGNPEMLMTAQADEEFYQIMNNADLIVPDGIGLVLAARHFIGIDVPERVTGFDLSTRFFALAAEKGYSIYLLGGNPGVVDEAALALQERYPELQIRGTHHGYLTDEVREQVIAEIAALRPDMLLVGMGAPRQDKFIADYKDRYQVPVSIGIGGCIDIWAGKSKRAPEFMQSLHLEWFYRLVREPYRFFRVLALPKFVYFAARFKERRIT